MARAPEGALCLWMAPGQIGRKGCFQHDEILTHSIRVVSIEDQPWFVAADVLKSLGMPTDKGVGKYLFALGSDERMLTTPGQIGGKGMAVTTIISESGLYKFTMRSDKPQAKSFQDWVTKEVLPSIRKTGSYVTGQPSLVENPKMSALQLAWAQIDSMQAILTALDEQERIQAKQAQ